MSQKQMETFQKLFGALVKLAQEKAISEIRVVDIAKTAGVHRATFYRHVEDAQDLLERGTEYFWNDLLASMEEVRVETSGLHTHSAVPQYLQHFFRKILENSDVFKAFLYQESSNYFQTHMRKRMVDFVAKYRLVYIGDEKHKHHLAAMISASLFATIEFVVKHGSYEPYLSTYYSFVKRENKLDYV